MCGIFSFFSYKGIDAIHLKKCADLIQHRGPDNSKEVILRRDTLYYRFHRLAINGLDHESDEPIHYYDPLTEQHIWLMCNGEIYNHQKLEYVNRFSMNTRNDCECIIHLYRKYGFQRAIEMLDGVFSIVLYDSLVDSLFIANDPIGIRPLFMGYGRDYLAFASEPIALRDCCSNIRYFPPGCLLQVDFNDIDGMMSNDIFHFQRYFFYNWYMINSPVEKLYKKYAELLKSATHKRMMGERPIACLLSGGLDSSLISALVAKELKKTNKKLHTFSIGLENSPDLKYAMAVSKHIGSVHHNVVVTEEQFLACIPNVIRAVQSFDTTTIRASCGNYLIAKYIRENTDFKIIFNGDVSEEINSSYYYSTFAPSHYHIWKDNQKLLREVHKYDVLRSARCVEHFGLEARTPFADKKLVNFVMSIHPKYKAFGKNEIYHMEKMLLRTAMLQDDREILPAEVLFRPKTAFSDGVSEEKRSWHKIISEYIDLNVTDKEYEREAPKMTHPLVRTKEAYFYRKIFREHLGNRVDMEQLIGEYWMPRFVDESIVDPSAREL